MGEPVGKEDQDAAGHHAAAPPSGADHGAWHGQLIGIGSALDKKVQYVNM